MIIQHGQVFWLVLHPAAFPSPPSGGVMTVASLAGAQGF